MARIVKKNGRLSKSLASTIWEQHFSDIIESLSISSYSKTTLCAGDDFLQELKIRLRGRRAPESSAGIECPDIASINPGFMPERNGELVLSVDERRNSEMRISFRKMASRRPSGDGYSEFARLLIVPGMLSLEIIGDNPDSRHVALQMLIKRLNRK